MPISKLFFSASEAELDATKLALKKVPKTAAASLEKQVSIGKIHIVCYGYKMKLLDAVVVSYAY